MFTSGWGNQNQNQQQQQQQPQQQQPQPGAFGQPNAFGTNTGTSGKSLSLCAKRLAFNQSTGFGATAFGQQQPQQPQVNPMFGNLQNPAPSGQSGGFGTCLRSFLSYHFNTACKARLTTPVRQVRLVNLSQPQVLARFRGVRARLAVLRPPLVKPQTQALASSVSPPLRPLAPRLGVQVLLELVNLRPRFSALHPASSPLLIYHI